MSGSRRYIGGRSAQDLVHVMEKELWDDSHAPGREETKQKVEKPVQSITMPWTSTNMIPNTPVVFRSRESHVLGQISIPFDIGP